MELINVLRRLRSNAKVIAFDGVGSHSSEIKPVCQRIGFTNGKPIGIVLLPVIFSLAYAQSVFICVDRCNQRAYVTVNARDARPQITQINANKFLRGPRIVANS